MTLEEFVRETFPKLDVEATDRMLKYLSYIGVHETNDLEHASEEDLQPIFKKIEARKLLSKAKKGFLTRLAEGSSLLPAIGFLVGLTKDTSTPGTIRFDAVIRNVGQGYTPNTGIFTAPRAGTYFFSMSAHPSKPIRIYLMKNGVSVVVAAGNDNTVSNSAVIDLKVGDTVWVQRSHLADAILLGVRSEPEHGVGDSYYTTFTGYIIDTVYDTC